MAFYINDSIFGSIFFFLTGLHFFHVVVGIILISIILGIVSIVSLPPASPNQATLHRLCDAGRRGSETKSENGNRFLEILGVRRLVRAFGT